MGHVGMTPQSVHAFGGFKVQGRDEATRAKVMADAIAVAEAGAYALVLETIPADLAKEVTERVGVPTIGIGAGVGCDGQVLVMHDLLGLDDSFKPKFVRRYADLQGQTLAAFRQYAEDVRTGEFPGDAETFR